jgi:hypothetical protein
MIYAACVKLKYSSHVYPSFWKDQLLPKMRDRCVEIVLDPPPAQFTLALLTAKLYSGTRISAEGHNVKISLKTPLASW